MTLDVSIIAGSSPILVVMALVGLVLVVKWVADIWP